MRLHTLTIVGVGLIGGSIGQAVKRRGLAARVLGIGRHQASLDAALGRGAIDEAHLDLEIAARQSELIIFCTPVDAIANQVLAAAAVCPPGTLLTDAGSTKAAILRAVDGRLPGGIAFVGSHPLAGSEKRGPQHADPNLFEGRLTLVTPTAATDPAALERIIQLWKSLGSRVRVMDPDDHDQALALTSHLPHLVASAMAGILPPDFRELTASGFRDCTRIAAGDARIWTSIFIQNREAVLSALGLFTHRLADFQKALESADQAALAQLWSQAKQVRDALGS
jgi:prephenate dehydrogenase